MSDHKQTRLSLGQKRKILALLVFLRLDFFPLLPVIKGGKITRFQLSTTSEYSVTNRLNPILNYSGNNYIPMKHIKFVWFD